MNITERISQMCESKGISINKLEQETGIGRGNVARWTDHSPSLDKIQRVAEYFGITVSDLLGEEKKLTPEDELAYYLDELKNDPNQRILFNLVSNATVDEVKATVAFLRTLRHIDE